MVLTSSSRGIFAPQHAIHSMLKVSVIIGLVSIPTILAGVVVAQRPPSAVQLLEKGVEKLDEEQYEQALSYLNESIKLNPKYGEAYAARGEVKDRLNDLDGAMVDYAICVELLPDQYDPLFSLAVIRYELKLYELAKLDFLKLQHLPTGVTNRILYRQTAQGTGTDKIMTAQGMMKSELYNYLGLIETKLNNCRQGILYIDSAIRFNASEADYYVNRALAKQACNDKTAQDDFRKALAINPDHALTKHNQAVQAKQDSFDQTEAQLTEIIQNDSTLQYPYIARAYYRLTNNNLKGALADYNHAIKIDGHDPHLWLNRGLTKEKLQDYVGAFSDYTKAIELKENFANAWMNRGNVLMKQDRFADAIEDYTVAILHQPNYGYAYLNRALSKHYQKQAGACEDLKQAETMGMKIEKSLKEEICKNN
jgi:tetratricopeptide (TPR) repeat protein